MNGELIPVIIAIIGVGATLAAIFVSAFIAFAKMQNQRAASAEARMMAHIDASETRMMARMDCLEARMIERINAFEARVMAHIDAVEARMIDRINAFESRLVARIDQVGIWRK